MPLRKILAEEGLKVASGPRIEDERGEAIAWAPATFDVIVVGVAPYGMAEKGYPVLKGKSLAFLQKWARDYAKATMSEDVATLKVAARYAVSRQGSGAGNPHIDEGLLRKLEGLRKLAEKARDEFSTLSPIFDRAWGAYEDIYWKTQKDWVAKGNDPDDFTDLDLNPDGYSMARALQWYEEAAHAMKSSSFDRNNIGRAISSIEDEIDELLRSAKR
jgi:hypothetical protein